MDRACVWAVGLDSGSGGRCGAWGAGRCCSRLSHALDKGGVSMPGAVAQNGASSSGQGVLGVADPQGQPGRAWSGSEQGGSGGCSPFPRCP